MDLAMTDKRVAILHSAIGVEYTAQHLLNALFVDNAEYVIIIGEHCLLPTKQVEYNQNSFVLMHLDNIENKSRWVNPYQEVRHRGLPYFVGKAGQDLPRTDVVANYGLVLDHPDYCYLAYYTNDITKNEPYVLDNKIVPHGTLVPLNLKNVCFKRSMGLLYGYHPFLHDIQVGDISRDLYDIQVNLINKIILDHLNLKISFGMPILENMQGPLTDRLGDLTYEIERHDEFCKFISNVQIDDSCRTLEETYLFVANLEELGTIGYYMKRWYDLFKAAENGDRK